MRYEGGVNKVQVSNIGFITVYGLNEDYIASETHIYLATLTYINILKYTDIQCRPG